MSGILLGQILKLGTCIVEVREPSTSPKAVLMLLPGWNYSRTCWCDSSRVCEAALREGYRLLLLEMGKSIYASQVLPTTRRDWAGYPTLRTLLDTVFPALIQDGYFWPGRTYVMGLSTGGRGVVLLLAHTDTLFRAGAALSGDFDPHHNPKDPLLVGWYGPYGPLWDSLDNPLRLALQIRSPLYLAHGKRDRIVPAHHSATLYKVLQAKRPDLLCLYEEDPAGGHDFTFWEAYGLRALAFFRDL